MCLVTEHAKLKKRLADLEAQLEVPLPRLPHPEELPDYAQTLENIDIDLVFEKWVIEWSVPSEYTDFWRNSIVITVTNDIAYPAQTWEENGKRHLDIKPEWLNPGVLAHEQAHNSYALLTDKEKADFALVYNAIRELDPMIKLLYSINTYGLSNDIEGHAEVYRYIGQQTANPLKKYYPKLF